MESFFNIQSALTDWCFSFKKNAKQIVETWDKLFKSAKKEQHDLYLYLANDILLMSSRCRSSEFVNEFWRVLPPALKHVYESDESGKKLATKLVSLLTFKPFVKLGFSYIFIWDH